MAAAIGSGAEEFERGHCVVIELLYTLEAEPTIFRHAQPRKHAAVATTSAVALAAARRGGPWIQLDLSLRVLPEELAEVCKVVFEFEQVGLHLCVDVYTMAWWGESAEKCWAMQVGGGIVRSVAWSLESFAAPARG